MKKLFLLIVLAVVYNGSVLGMVDTDSTEQMYQSSRGEHLVDTFRNKNIAYDFTLQLIQTVFPLV